MATAAISQKENHLHPTEARWFAVYTKYKCEKVVSKDLAAKGIECYVPLQKVTRKYTRKVKTHYIPLINCYAFVKIAQADYVSVLETDYVLGFIKIGRNLIAIPEREIEILRKVVGEGLSATIEDKSFQVGDQVEIVSGQLTGLKGKLVDTDKGKQVVVELEMLGKDLYMQIAPEFLQKTSLGNL